MHARVRARVLRRPRPLEHEEADGYAFVRSLQHAQRARAVIWHRPPPDFATRIVPRIGEVELPDHVFEPEPDYRISDEERAALAYVRSGPRGIGGADLTAEQLFSLVDLVALFAGRLPPRSPRRRCAGWTPRGWRTCGSRGRAPRSAATRHYYRVQGPGC